MTNKYQQINVVAKLLQCDLSKPPGVSRAEHSTMRPPHPPAAAPLPVPPKHVVSPCADRTEGTAESQKHPGTKLQSSRGAMEDGVKRRGPGQIQQQASLGQG